MTAHAFDYSYSCTGDNDSTTPAVRRFYAEVGTGVRLNLARHAAAIASELPPVPGAVIEQGPAAPVARGIVVGRNGVQHVAVGHSRSRLARSADPRARVTRVDRPQSAEVTASRLWQAWVLEAVGEGAE